MTLAQYMLENPAPNRQWHPSRNGLDPRQLTPGSKRRSWFRCDAGHEWEAAVHSVVLDGCGCPYCAGKTPVPGENVLATVKPELLSEWDFEKNTDVDPGKILPSTHRKVWWKCDLGHSWQAAVFSRSKEKTAGCPYCAGRLVLAGFNDLASLRPELAAQWHQPLNGALQPTQVTLGSNKKVWWQCGEGHVWLAYIYSRARKNGTGCPICAGRRQARP